MTHVVIAALLCFLVGCGGSDRIEAPLSSMKSQLQGKWMNKEMNWGIEVIEDTIREWENGRKQRESLFRVKRTDNGHVLVILDDADPVSFPIEFVDDGRIRLNTHDQLLKKIKGTYWIELENVNRNP